MLILSIADDAGGRKMQNLLLRKVELIYVLVAAVHRFINEYQ